MAKKKPEPKKKVATKKPTGQLADKKAPKLPPLGAKVSDLLSVFDEAARDWGWANDQGSGARATRAEKYYEESKDALWRYISSLEKKLKDTRNLAAYHGSRCIELQEIVDGLSDVEARRMEACQEWERREWEFRERILHLQNQVTELQASSNIEIAALKQELEQSGSLVKTLTENNTKLNEQLASLMAEHMAEEFANGEASEPTPERMSLDKPLTAVPDDAIPSSDNTIAGADKETPDGSAEQ